jgi:hypothetical protein
MSAWQALPGFGFGFGSSLLQGEISLSFRFVSQSGIGVLYFSLLLEVGEVILEVLTIYFTSRSSAISINQ